MHSRLEFFHSFDLLLENLCFCWPKCLRLEQGLCQPKYTKDCCQPNFKPAECVTKDIYRSGGLLNIISQWINYQSKCSRIKPKIFQNPYILGSSIRNCLCFSNKSDYAVSYCQYVIVSACVGIDESESNNWSQNRTERPQSSQDSRVRVRIIANSHF